MPYNYVCPRCDREVPIGRDCPSCYQTEWTLWGVLTCIGIVVALVLFSNLAGCQPKPPVANALDREILKRTQLQLSTIQADFQREYAKITDPILKEQAEVLHRNCDPLKIAIQDCVVDTVTGAVTKRQPPKQDARK